MGLRKYIVGYKVKFNWILKLKLEYGLPGKLEAGKIYKFQKPEERIYPIGIVIELWDYKNNHALAKVQIIEFKVSKNKTEGKFKISEVL